MNWFSFQDFTPCWGTDSQKVPTEKKESKSKKKNIIFKICELLRFCHSLSDCQNLNKE